jgi:hypothetical protein
MQALLCCFVVTLLSYYCSPATLNSAVGGRDFVDIYLCMLLSITLVP